MSSSSEDSSAPSDLKPVWVIGAGGHGKVVISALLASGRKVAGVVDRDPAIVGNSIAEFVVQDTSCLPPNAAAILAIGNSNLRKMRSENLSMDWQTVIHPTAIVDSTARIGQGSVIMAGAIIQADTVIGEHAIVNTGAIIDHDCWLGDFCHVCPGVRLAGLVTAQAGSMICIGANVIPGITIGSGAVVGAGAVVVRDVDSQTTVVGVPARRPKKD